MSGEELTTATGKGASSEMKYFCRHAKREGNRSAFFLFLVIYCATSLLGVKKASAEAEKKEVGEVKLRVLPPSETEHTQGIPSLSFKKSSFPLVVVNALDSSPQMTTTLEGRYPLQDSSLLIREGGKMIARSKINGSFSVRVPISQPETLLTFTSIDSWGHALNTRVLLKSSDWADVQAKIHASQASRRFHWNLRAGITHLDYSQTGIPEISSWLVSTQAAVEYWLKPNQWNLSLSGYFTPVPITTTPSGLSILFLGINARVGYALPWIAAPWRLALTVGAYYATTFTSQSPSSSLPSAAQFGYVNIGGPEFYPTLARTFESGSSLSAYFKFSPVSDQFTVLSFSNREIASGLSYNFSPNHAGQNFLLTFDWANLIVREVGTEASSTTLSLGGGYRW
jgi:hypothetical protein